MTSDEAIRVEQARLIHRNVPPAVIGGFLVVCLVVAVFWSVVPPNRLLLWMGAIAVLSVYRMAVWGQFRQIDFTFANAQRWLRYSMVGAGLSGVLWGGGSLFLSPPVGEVDYQLTLVWAVVMMSTAAMFSFSAHYPSFLAFCVPSVVPVIASLVSKDTGLHWGIAGGMLLFMAMAVRFMWTFNQVFIQSLQLRFENAELVAKLTEQKDAAEAANLAKSRFLAVASHDLRQPMHALNLYLGSLAGMPLSETARLVLGNARQCAQAMDEMFRALLDISRLDAGSIQADLRTFELGPLLDRIRVEFEPQARDKGLQLRVTGSSAVVYSDPALVERILRNLATNAVLHTQRGKVLVGCRRRPGGVSLGVYDTGPGIAPGQHGKIFEEFYQLGNPERDRSKGLGLGLAIVQRLARLLDTPVTLRSEVGRGSLFAVDLPHAGDRHAPSQAPAAAAEARTDLGGLFVVVVDDEKSILDATRILLEAWGCHVVTAGSGADALEQLATSPRTPDVLACDYRLRGDEDGVAVIRALRAEFNEDIPALLITGDSAPERIRDIEATGLPLLHKPLGEDELRNTIARLAGDRAPSLCDDQAQAARRQHGLRTVGHA